MPPKRRIDSRGFPTNAAKALTDSSEVEELKSKVRKLQKENRELKVKLDQFQDELMKREEVEMDKALERDLSPCVSTDIDTQGESTTEFGDKEPETVDEQEFTAPINSNTGGVE